MQFNSELRTYLPRPFPRPPKIRGVVAVVVDESISHVLQTCPITHWERIRRHNEIVDKIARHCKIRGWSVEDEPYVRHRTEELFKPDLAVHQPGHILVIADVQVSWDSPELGVSYYRKRRKYDTPRFREAASTRWPGKSTCSPLLLWAPGASGPGSITNAPMFSGYPPRYAVLA
jgi:hypothetical protein